MMTLLYLLLLPMLSGIGMLGLGPALMAGRAGAAHVVLLLSGLLLPLLPFLPEPCILLPQAPQPSIQDLLHSGVEVRLVPAPDQRRKILLLPGVGSRIARPGRLIGRSRLCKPLHPLYLSHGDTSFPW